MLARHRPFPASSTALAAERAFLGVLGRVTARLSAVMRGSRGRPSVLRHHRQARRQRCARTMTERPADQAARIGADAGGELALRGGWFLLGRLSQRRMRLLVTRAQNRARRPEPAPCGIGPSGARQPLMRIEFTAEPRGQRPWLGSILTSRNGLRALASWGIGREWRARSRRRGRHRGSRAREAGFSDVRMPAAMLWRGRVHRASTFARRASLLFIRRCATAPQTWQRCSPSSR